MWPRRRAERIELDENGELIVVVRATVPDEQVGQRRGLRTKRWSDYFSKRFRECLERLAQIYGFATEKR